MILCICVCMLQCIHEPLIPNNNWSSLPLQKDLELLRTLCLRGNKSRRETIKLEEWSYMSTCHNNQMLHSRLYISLRASEWSVHRRNHHQLPNSACQERKDVIDVWKNFFSPESPQKLLLVQYNDLVLHNIKTLNERINYSSLGYFL